MSGYTKEYVEGIKSAIDHLYMRSRYFKKSNHNISMELHNAAVLLEKDYERHFRNMGID